MNIESISITKNRTLSKVDQTFRASIKTTHKKHEVTLRLDGDLSMKLISILKDELKK